jgi:hypothetical protein
MATVGQLHAGQWLHRNGAPQAQSTLLNWKAGVGEEVYHLERRRVMDEDEV